MIVSLSPEFPDPRSKTPQSLLSRAQVRSAQLADYRATIVDVFNLVVGRTPAAEAFGSGRLRALLMLKFGRDGASAPLDDSERSATRHDVRAHESRAALCLRLQVFGDRPRVGDWSFR